MIDRMWDWLRPIMPPMMAFIEAAHIINVFLFGLLIRVSIISGASFCQVDKIKQLIHEMDIITEGYQKWQGALPSFNRRATHSIITIQ